MTTLRTWVQWVLRIMACLSMLWSMAAHAHEVVPAIADLNAGNGKLSLSINTPVEGFIAGVDLTSVTDTNASPVAQSYDALRALSVQDIETRFRAFWPEMARRMRITADGTSLPLTLDKLEFTDTPDLDQSRPAMLTISAALPAGTKNVTVEWDKGFGAMVLRQQGVDKPFTGLLEVGGNSGPISVQGGGEVSAWRAFLDYIPVGFDHIVPKGLDHILFVLGLFFLSTSYRPLLWQITAFTLAHTVTLALSSLGFIDLPANTVEPLIAASIVFVALENIWSKGELSRWRPLVVFGFGLLHGLGFASVLGEFGLPEANFIPALIGFNVGVELGQLAVVAVAALLCWTWAARQDWYRAAIAVPASLAIAAVGAFWVIERTLL